MYWCWYYGSGVTNGGQKYQLIEVMGICFGLMAGQTNYSLAADQFRFHRNKFEH